ncbi:MAG: hypothetical protein ACNA8L_01190 [Luteolibacter sp.]
MSRRARRKNGGAKSGAGWVVKLAVFLLVVSIGAGAVGYGLIRSYLHSDAFRLLLSNQVSKALDVDGAFAPLRWDGLSARTGKFEAVGEGELIAIRAEDVRTEIGLGGFRDGYWLLRGSVVRNLEVVFDARSGDDELPRIDLDVTPPPLPKPRQARRWFPTEIRYDTVDVENLSAMVVLDHGELQLRNHRVRALSAAEGDAVDFTARGGTITTPLEWIPALRLEEIKGRHQDGSVFVTCSQFRVFGNGVLDAAGEWNGENGFYGFQGKATGIDCADLLDEDWARRLTGRVLVDFTVEDRDDGPRARGTAEIRDGMLTALPLLDSLSAYADTQRFRMLTLHEARVDWEWMDGRFVFTNIRLTSEGLVRIFGTLTIGKEGELDGSFRLGLAPGTLARIPGAETVVFQPGEHGLLWTSLKVSGTLEKPSEDLTSRLIAAAGLRMFEILPETGERVLRHTRTLLGELPQSALDRAREVLGGGKDENGNGGGLLRGAGNLLDGILGGSRRDRIEPEKEVAEP